MAFCTQRKFPGQSYDNSELAEINKMKAYGSIKDHRAWSIDRTQQASYLVDAVHKGEGDTIDLQHTMAIGIAGFRSDAKKFSKRVGTADVDQSVVSQGDSLQIFELSMELEETKLKNSTLKSENVDLRKRIANIMASDHGHDREDNMQNHLQMLEAIISERNDLRELLDKFLSITDQIVDLKMQADQMKDMENDYISLQAKFKGQEKELEMLRNEKETFEDRMRRLDTTEMEANALKESNSKLEKDLVKLSNVISVSDSFIHDQELELKTKLHIISEMNQQIDNLKMALSEAELKLNKKLRLEMDVELMEKELSMMIENSAESSPDCQQVVDRQVEDLATAIKLTLGCMNYEFENNEEDNTVEANRKLKALLLESSNKILEFKDVINKQEQNLMKVSNEFACKNDELTECLATVEDLKRQLVNQEATTTGSPNVVLPGTDVLPTVGLDEEQEIFENEINLADSPQISENEDDGPEIEDLEKIFEKSCSQQETGDAYKITSGLRGLKQSTRKTEELKLFNQMTSNLVADRTTNDQLKVESKEKLSEKQVDNERDVCEAAATAYDKEELTNLRNANEQLRRKISCLERDAQIANKSVNLLQRGRLSAKSQQFESDLLSDDVKRIENENLNLKLENEKLVVEIGKLKNLGNSSHLNVLEMKKELEKLSSINEQLTAELSAKKLEKDSVLAKELEAMPPDIRDLVLKNDELRKENENLLLKNRFLEHADKSDRPKTTTDLPGQSQGEENVTEPDWLPSNEDLVAEIEKLQQSKNKSNLTIRQMEKDLRKMEMANENLSVRLNDKEAELKHRSISPDIEVILKQNEELKMLNRNLTAEINEMRKPENPDRSNEANMKEELTALESVNKALTAEINELKQIALMGGMKTDQQVQIMNDSFKDEGMGPVSIQNSSHISIMKIGKDLERLAALNESLLALNDRGPDKVHTLLDDMSPDINQLLKKSQELKLTNENLSSKVRELQDTEDRTHVEAIETANQLKTLAAANEQLEARIKEMERCSSNDQTTNLHSLRNENENLKTTNAQLTEQIDVLETKLRNIENRTATYFNEQHEPRAVKREQTPMHTDDTLNMEMDWMVADMKKLQNRNDSLRSTNEKLLSQISELQACVNYSDTTEETKNSAETMLDIKESDAQLIYACNRNIEIDWMKTDMDVLHKKNEKLKSTNDVLVAEIGALKCSETQAQKNIQQMEKDLLKLSAMNERLSTQLNEKKCDKKQLLKVRSQELETKDLLKKIDELTISNENFASEITALKGTDMVKMRSDLRRLSSTNDNLKMQIAEMSLLSSNELKMESNWMAADMKKLFNKNKKLNISNQNLMNEINEMRKEFKSLENRANVNALQKVKEMDRLTCLNENLKDQLNVLNNERKNCNCNDINSNCSITDMRKVHKKNEELKSANEKLLSVIINLKNSEKQANSKVAEMESELYKLRETNKSLQDTLENYVEKDWSIPKTELERICQSILNDGVYSLTNTEHHYMQNWFGKAVAADYDVAKTARKNTTRKHCKICHNSADAFGKACECKQYEEKKRLNLLKEIEETKLAIQHIQKSNDIEFDLNDVKNRLLKGKPSDSSDNDTPYDLRMSQSQGSVNVRAHIITKCVKRNHQPRK